MRALTAGLLVLLLTTIGQAQDRGVFSEEIHIRADTSTSRADTTMIGTTSRDYTAGMPTMTIFYKFLDTGTVGTTLYFQARVQGMLTVHEYVTVDSLVVSTTDTDFRVWNITDGAVGITDRFRLTKSVATDTLVAIYRGFAEIPK